MSTISDALKKAQHRRTAGNPEPAAPPAAHEDLPHPRGRSSARRAPTTPNLFLVAVLPAIVVSVILLCAIRYGLFGPPAKAPAEPDRQVEAPQPPPLASTPVVPSSAVAPTEPAQAEAPPASPPKVEAPVAPPPVVTPAIATNSEPPVVQAPPRPATPPAPLPVLTGTFYSEKDPVAIIDGFSLKEGETVGAYRVAKILQTSVVLKSSAGDEFELRLK